MAYSIDFDKAIAEQFLDALKSGQPIKPPREQWDIHGALALAGACYFFARSHGPLDLIFSPGAWEQLPREHREAKEETLVADLHLAISFYAMLTEMVNDGEFDKRYEPHVRALIYEDDTGRHLRVYEGFRQI
jgi:hypothetical protein